VTWNQIDVGAQSTDTSGDDEWDLDSQYSTGFAPGVTQINVYDGPSLNDPDILTTIDKWVTDDLTRQGSFSAGECDLLAGASGFTSGLDAVLQQADAQGQTMFFSSGDTGSQCPALTGVNGVPAGIPDTNYPASSPYGIGVGGTSASAPSWQGIWARVEGAHSGGISFAGPVLYSTEPSTAFTGLGTPDISKLIGGA
jgi:subtilase family serine protease